MTGERHDGEDILRRTYLHLRLSLVAVVAAIFLAVVFTPSGFLPDGTDILRSISHYFYTPARTVFTAALCAASLALLSLAGPGVQNRLLDLAALLAPLIAIVPTRVLPAELGAEAGLAGCVAGWPAGLDCIPADQLSQVELGFWVWVVLVTAGLVVAVVRGIRSRIRAAGYWATVGAGAGVVAVYLVLRWSPWSTLTHEGLQMWGHVLAASAFFLLITVVAVIEAFRQWTRQGQDPAFLPRVVYAVVYAVLAVVMVAAVGAAVVIVLRPTTVAGDAVFWAEAVGLAAFAAFWIFQTVEHSRDAVGWQAVRLRRGRA